MVRYNYNRQVDPPAPFVHVVLTRPDASIAPTEWAAQLNTGADVTVVPAGAVQAMALAETGQCAACARCWWRSGACRESSDVLLGRDVLNQYRILLDGPSLTFEVQEGSA